MHRLLVDHEVQGDIVTLTDPSRIHHLKDVLRLPPGSEITILDTRSREYLASIQEIDKRQVKLSILKQNTLKTGTARITLACAIPKGQKMDDIVDKLTQLGVDSIIPMQTARVIVKLEGKQETRVERWRKIALSAVEQSHRCGVPVITDIRSIKEVLDQANEYDLKLIPTLAFDRKPLKEVLVGIQPQSILVLIGPEGDFSPEEIETAMLHGFIPVSLGDSVLRVDTAAIAVASYLKFNLLE